MSADVSALIFLCPCVCYCSSRLSVRQGRPLSVPAAAASAATRRRVLCPVTWGLQPFLCPRCSCTARVRAISEYWEERRLQPAEPGRRAVASDGLVISPHPKKLLRRFVAAPGECRTVLIYVDARRSRGRRCIGHRARKPRRAIVRCRHGLGLRFRHFGRRGVRW